MTKSILVGKIGAIFIAIVTIFIVSNLPVAFAEDEDVSQIIKYLNSSDYLERRIATAKLTGTVPPDFFERLERAKQTGTVLGEGLKWTVKEKYIKNEEIRTALINLFIKESKKPIVGEGYGEYYSHLADLVASLKDERAVPVLLDNIEGRVVEDYLSEMKDKRILERMLRDVKHDYSGKRARALRIMSKMCKLKSVNRTDRKKIKEILIKSLEDKDARPRRSALRGLGELVDELDGMDIIPLVESLAKNDPYSYEIDASARGGIKGEKIKIYPVREEAQKFLEKLKEKQ